MVVGVVPITDGSIALTDERVGRRLGGPRRDLVLEVIRA
jgi:hypothetical protein